MYEEMIIIKNIYIYSGINGYVISVHLTSLCQPDTHIKPCNMFTNFKFRYHFENKILPFQNHPYDLNLSMKY